jgi:hypothetical protein
MNRIAIQLEGNTTKSGNLYGVLLQTVNQIAILHVQVNGLLAKNTGLITIFEVSLDGL